MAEWLRSGLQIRVLRFDSGRGLHFLIYGAIMNNNIAGVILAGGKGKRLGGVLKATLKVGGISLFERTAGALSGVNGPRLFSIGNVSPASFASNTGWIKINDLDSEARGPLAGLAAAVAYLRENDKKVEYLLSVAVDTPFFPQDFFQKALEIFNNDEKSDVVVASYNAQLYPTNAVWRFGAIADLPENLTQVAKFGIRSLYKTKNMRELALDDCRNYNPCQSVNDIEDVLNCGRIAKLVSQPKRLAIEGLANDIKTAK